MYDPQRLRDLLEVKINDSNAMADKADKDHEVALAAVEALAAFSKAFAFEFGAPDHMRQTRETLERHCNGVHGVYKYHVGQVGAYKDILDILNKETTTA